MRIKKMKNELVFEESSGNVYADLGMKNADEMLRKAQLAARIKRIIDDRGLTQRQAALMLGMQQPKLSLLLRGQFRGISEGKMLAYLSRLGNNVRIIISEPPETSPRQGNIEVMFA
jgi:predicted XRE-type DNA-binding protein